MYCRRGQERREFFMSQCFPTVNILVVNLHLHFGGQHLTNYPCYKLVFTSVAALLMCLLVCFIGCCSHTSIIYADICFFIFTCTMYVLTTT